MEPPADRGSEEAGRPAWDAPPDHEMIQRVMAGDEAAARALFDRYAPTLRARVRSKLPPSMRRKVAESDVLQETFLAAFLSLGDFEDRGEDSFRRWLGKILEHRILDEVRRYVRASKRDVRREHSVSDATRSLLRTSGDPSPSMKVMAAEERAALWLAVEDLPEDYRTVIRLIHQQGMTLAQAGEQLGRSAEAARKLYGRALARLARGMDGTEKATG